MPRAKKNMYDNVSPRIVKVIPLGGLEQIGMNMTVFEYGQSLIVVDAGLAFPGGNMLLHCYHVLRQPPPVFMPAHSRQVRGAIICQNPARSHAGAEPGQRKSAPSGNGILLSGVLKKPRRPEK